MFWGVNANTGATSTATTSATGTNTTSDMKQQVDTTQSTTTNSDWTTGQPTGSTHTPPPYPNTNADRTTESPAYQPPQNPTWTDKTYPNPQKIDGTNQPPHSGMPQVTDEQRRKMEEQYKQQMERMQRESEESRRRTEEDMKRREEEQQRRIKELEGKNAPPEWDGYNSWKYNNRPGWVQYGSWYYNNWQYNDNWQHNGNTGNQEEHNRKMEEQRMKMEQVQREMMERERMEQERVMEEHRMRMDHMERERMEREKIEQNMRDMDRMRYEEQDEGEIKKIFMSLPEDVKIKIKELDKKFHENMMALSNDFMAAWFDNIRREELEEKLQKLRAEHHDEMKRILAGQKEALTKLEERKEVFKQNRELRNDVSETRKSFRGENKQRISKYKEVFLKRLWNKLDKVPTDKLETLIMKINTIIAKYSANTRLPEEKKRTILSQLEALKDIVNLRLDKVNTDEELNIEAILEVD
jgi:hypothetical protein